VREDGGGRGLPRYYFLGLLFCCVAPRGGVTGRPELSPPYGNFFLSAGCNTTKMKVFNSVGDPDPEPDPRPLVRVRIRGSGSYKKETDPHHGFSAVNNVWKITISLIKSELDVFLYGSTGAGSFLSTNKHRRGSGTNVRTIPFISTQFSLNQPFMISTRKPKNCRCQYIPYGISKSEHPGTWCIGTILKVKRYVLLMQNKSKIPKSTRKECG
jgi:hypothetical protein